MKIYHYCIAALLWIMSSCTSQTTNSEKCIMPSATWAILDTDLGSSTDDLVAMTMLYDAHRKGDIELKAIMVNRPGIPNMRIADIMNTYYGFDGLAIGKPNNAPQNAQIFIDYGSMAMPENNQQSTNFKRFYTDEQLTQMQYAEDLYRQILSEANDTSVVIFSIGFPTNIAHLLESKADKHSNLDGVALVAQKVKALYIQGGHLSNYSDEPEYNLLQDPQNAQILIEKWPTKIYFSPGETGERFDYKPDTVINDQKINNLADSPLCYVYTHYNCDTGQKMWDACAILQYLHPEFFEHKGPVRYSIDKDMCLHENPGTLHYITYTKTAQQDSIVMNYIRQSSLGGLCKQ